MTGFVLRGATVVDGTGGPARVVDVSVRDARIDGVGAVEFDGRPEVDGSGKVLAPGFIDTHTHDDFAALLYPDMGFKVQGGVTTCVVGNCGFGVAPFRWGSAMARAFHPDATFDEWDGYGGYLDRLDAEPPAVNIAALIGHGTVRAGAMRFDERAPSASELEAMQATVAEGMEAGCVGMSSGLIYPPGIWADTDELVALAEVVADHGGIYTSHIRNEADRLLEAIDEAIAVGAVPGCPW